jgi:thioredoxin-dependent peroxiredoxin
MKGGGSRSWTENPWLLVVLMLVIAVAAGNLVRLLRGRGADPAAAVAERPRDPKDRYTPEFKAGDPAPDFTLPDAKGTPRTLSELAKQETLLFFTCGCTPCTILQSYVARLLPRMNDRAPRVITVASTAPEDETHFRRVTRLPQTIVYERHGGPVMETYRARPCPRVFGLDAGGRVKWIGSSTMQAPLEALQSEIAAHLAVSPGGGPRPGASVPPAEAGASPAPSSSGGWVLFESLGQGTPGSVEPAKPVAYLATKSAEVKRFAGWLRHDHRQAAERNDFNTYALLAVFAGAKPTGGHLIGVSQVSLAGDRMEISVIQQGPPQNGAAIQAFTSPYHLVRIPREALGSTPPRSWAIVDQNRKTLVTGRR